MQAAGIRDNGIELFPVTLGLFLGRGDGDGQAGWQDAWNALQMAIFRRRVGRGGGGWGMDEIDRLMSVKGFGQGMLASIVESLGEEGLRRALESKDVSALSSVDRISGRMAVNLVLAYHGDEAQSILSNDGSRDVYEGVLDEMRSRMHTEKARDMCRLMVPSRPDPSKASEVHDYSSLVMERDRVASLLRSFSREPLRKKIKAECLIVAEDDHAYERVRQMGLDRFCMVTTAEELDSVDREIVYVYNGRELDETLLNAVHHVSCDVKPHEILPEVVLERFIPLRDRISNVSELQSIYGIEGKSPLALQILDGLVSMEVSQKGPEAIEEEVERVRNEVERSLRDALENVVLSGKDTLAMLSGDEPPALRDVYREHARKAQSLLRERLGVNRDLFQMKYPLAVDGDALTSLLREMEGERSERRFRSRVDAASELVGLEEALAKEIAWAYELDLKFGLGCMVLDLDLNPFQVSEGWMGIVDSCHISLRSGKYQGVTYFLGSVPPGMEGIFPYLGRSSSRMALLTGANSGGKTTLLETLAQVVIMAHMGLPVPAARAFVPELDSLHLYKPRRHMDAGGLESFLKDFLPLCLEAGNRSLLLADELEAMTELDAASRIIHSFLKELQGKGAYAVVVTHMAREVSRGREFRIDGIEANGLDEELNLIVDRTPKICFHARSMPELILRRLHGKSRGRERELYSKVLSEFTPPSS